MIGAGNVATHLGITLMNSGRQIIQVYSRTENSAKRLAEKLNAGFITNLNKISKDADLYIVSVPDDVVEKVTGKIRFENKLIVHTSGSLSMEILNGCSENFGVLYPLQTFSKTRKVDFSHIPLCIEANSKEGLQLIRNVAEDLSDTVREIDSEQRKRLHLAAVFASNFPNFMYNIAGQILSDDKFDFKLLLPLIAETSKKVEHMNPAEAQTGPAKRGDQITMEKHLEMLKPYPEYRKIYDLLSNTLANLYSKY